MKHNLHLKTAFLEVVENQLRDNNPPEARLTLQRLQDAGYSLADAKLLIASAIAAEVWAIMRLNKPSDPSRYLRYLKQLPDQAFNDEEDEPL